MKEGGGIRSSKSSRKALRSDEEREGHALWCIEIIIAFVEPFPRSSAIVLVTPVSRWFRWKSQEIRSAREEKEEEEYKEYRYKTPAKSRKLKKETEMEKERVRVSRERERERGSRKGGHWIPTDRPVVT